VILPTTSVTTHTFNNHTQRLVLPSFPTFLGGVWFYFGFTPYLVSVSACFCKYILSFKALFTTQHRHRPVVYPATRHPFDILHQLSKPMTWLWIYQCVRSRKAYQRSISDVLSSGCLKNPTKRECWDTRSVQSVRTDYDRIKTFVSCTTSTKYKQQRYDNITALPPGSRQARRWSSRHVWPREFHFWTSKCPAFLCFGCWGIPLQWHQRDPGLSVSKDFLSGCCQMTGCAGYTLGRGPIK